MTRYFVQPRTAVVPGKAPSEPGHTSLPDARVPGTTRSIARSDMDWEPIGNAWFAPTVADHEAADTGLVDQNGDPIMRAPNAMGFIWNDDA